MKHSQPIKSFIVPTFLCNVVEPNWKGCPMLSPRSQVTQFLEYLQALKTYQSQIVHIEHLNAKNPKYGTLESDLHPAISQGLVKRNIRLYSHQTTAINYLKSGKNIVITTGTGSGKTL